MRKALLALFRYLKNGQGLSLDYALDEYGNSIEYGVNRERSYQYWMIISLLKDTTACPLKAIVIRY